VLYFDVLAPSTFRHKLWIANGSAISEFDCCPYVSTEDFYAEYKKKNETLVGETASGIVAWSLEYTETSPGIDLWP
jgi:hypothetical protein